MPPKSPIVLIPLFTDLRVVTDGTQGWKYIDLDDVPQFRSLLPYCQDFSLVSNTFGRTQNHEWNLFFWSGFSRAHELGPFPLEAAATNINANTPKRHAAYTATGNFLLDSRLAIGTRNATGTAFESAICSAAIIARLWA